MNNKKDIRGFTVFKGGNTMSVVLTREQNRSFIDGLQNNIADDDPLLLRLKTAGKELKDRFGINQVHIKEAIKESRKEWK